MSKKKKKAKVNAPCLFTEVEREEICEEIKTFRGSKEYDSEKVKRFLELFDRYFEIIREEDKERILR